MATSTDETEHRGSMWDLDQKLDQPMDEEAGKLRNMIRQKYVYIVRRANDNGQGGTFALYSLLCRHARVNTIPNDHRTDEELTGYSRNVVHEDTSFAAKTKRWLMY